VVDVKSTGLYATDPVLKANGATVVYWKTGHSYIKRKTAELGALAGFEKSGHFFFNEPLGRGYDDALVAAANVLAMLDRNPGKRLSELRAELPVGLHLADHVAHCDDEKKYAVVEDVVRDYQAWPKPGEPSSGRRITEVITVNGVRVALEDGSWVLVPRFLQQARAGGGGRKPALGGRHARALPEEVKARLSKRPEVGAYNQEI
jgi:phosphomannomutase/phosphoglucomutase